MINNMKLKLLHYHNRYPKSEVEFLVKCSRTSPQASTFIRVEMLEL